MSYETRGVNEFRKEYVCANPGCGVKTIRNIKKVKDNANVYCSQSCSNQHRSVVYKGNTNKSKYYEKVRGPKQPAKHNIGRPLDLPKKQPKKYPDRPIDETGKVWVKVFKGYALRKIENIPT